MSREGKGGWKEAHVVGSRDGDLGLYGEKAKTVYCGSA